jgi:tRNA pseudouridine55 synthase
VNGKKLYEYARAGIEVERPVREVFIYELTLQDEREVFTGPEISFKFKVTCSKGTYVRTLAVMMGERLGYPAHMSDLVRIESAGFTLNDCKTFDEIEQAVAQGEISGMLQPLERGLYHLPKYQISDKVAKKVCNGSVLPIPEDVPISKGHPFVMIDENGKALAIYQIHPEKEHLIKPIKVLAID